MPEGRIAALVRVLSCIENEGADILAVWQYIRVQHCHLASRGSLIDQFSGAETLISSISVSTTQSTYSYDKMYWFRTWPDRLRSPCYRQLGEELSVHRLRSLPKAAKM